MRAWRGVIEEYRDWLPVSTDTPVITLLEGGTPLVRSASLSECLRGDVFLGTSGRLTLLAAYAGFVTWQFLKQ